MFVATVDYDVVVVVVVDADVDVGFRARARVGVRLGCNAKGCLKSARKRNLHIHNSLLLSSFEGPKLAC